MSLDATRANEILSYLHGGGAPPAITGLIHVRLMTTNGTATSNGTELGTAQGYTAGTGAPTIASWSAAASQSQATSAAVSVANMPAATIVGIELWSSDATPKRTEFGSHTSKVVASGDTLTYASGAITSSIT